jgi:endonuclease/exonuclease/phosphatase family metal-dependent hydrolase
MKNFAFLIMIISFSASGQSLKVMTYNIRYATEQDGINAWSKRQNKVFELLKREDPAIIGLQEALQSQIKDILDNLKEYDYIGVGRDDGKTKGEYSPILYKKSLYQIIEQSTFWLSETPTIAGSKSWDAAITRVATWARVKDKKSGKDFIVINTHFDHLGTVARKNSAEILKSKAAEISKGLPVIIMGDFNCTRKEEPYKVMMEPKEPILSDPAPANPPGTYCTFQVDSTPCIAIDYIFYTKEWSSQKYGVITDNDGKNYPSDHLPVTVQLAIGK